MAYLRPSLPLNAKNCCGLIEVLWRGLAAGCHSKNVNKYLDIFSFVSSLFTFCLHLPFSNFDMRKKMNFREFFSANFHTKFLVQRSRYKKWRYYDRNWIILEPIYELYILDSYKLTKSSWENTKQLYRFLQKFYLVQKYPKSSEKNDNKEVSSTVPQIELMLPTF